MCRLRRLGGAVTGRPGAARVGWVLSCRRGCRGLARSGTASTSGRCAGVRGRSRRHGGSATPLKRRSGGRARLAHAGAPSTGILPRQLLHQRADLRWKRQPSRRARIGPFPLDQPPVQASRVPRVTIRCSRSRPGRCLARAARTARSAQSGPGRATCRCKTATSCQSTRISASLTASLRASSVSQPKPGP